MHLDWSPLKRGDMVAGHKVEYVRRLKDRSRSRHGFEGSIHKFRLRDPEGRLWIYLHVGPRLRALVEPEIARDYPIILAQATPEQLAKAAAS